MFRFSIEPLHHLRECKAAEWVVTSSIQSSLWEFPLPYSRRENWKQIGRKVYSGEQEKSFFLSSWQYLNVIQLHHNRPMLLPIHHNVSTRTHSATPPSLLPIHYTLSAQKHSGTRFHPYRLRIPHALTNTSFFTPALPTNVIKHETLQIILVLCANLKHPISLTRLLLWFLPSDSFPI